LSGFVNADQCESAKPMPLCMNPTPVGPFNPLAHFRRQVFAFGQRLIPMIGPFFWRRRSLYSQLVAAEKRDGLSLGQIGEVMQPIYERGDRMMTGLILAHAALAVALAFAYGT